MSTPIPEEVTRRRDAIVLSALDHVPFDGWSAQALRAGAEDAGFPADVADITFPGDGRDAALHFLDMADRLMRADLLDHDLDALHIRERIHLAIHLRLSRWTAHRDAIARAMGLLALPGNAPVAVRAGYRTVDAIWKAIGDRSTDFNFYTKRASLAAVYAATLLYWLDDRSDDQTATWDFLARRLDDLIRGIQTRKRLTEGAGRLVGGGADGLGKAASMAVGAPGRLVRAIASQKGARPFRPS